MGSRIALMLSALLAAAPLAASGSRPGVVLAKPAVDQRVRDDGGVCWEPDIEFPVPCDEDDD